MADPTRDDLPPLVTQERLDLSVVFPQDRTLAIPVIDAETDEPAVRDFRVRGRLTIDDMGRLLDIESKLNDALRERRERLADGASSDEVTEEERRVIAVVSQANDCIRRILVARNAHVPEELGLDEAAVMVAMSWLVGDVSVADAVARAITADVSGAATEDELGVEAQPGLDGDGAGDAAPLGSRTSS